MTYQTSSTITLFTICALFVAVLTSTSCNNPTQEFGIFGDSTLTEDGAIAAAEIPAMLVGHDSIHVKAKATINAVCQAKGCWMDVPISEDEDMTIRFKGYKFFVPKNSSGREAIIEGMAFVDTISVADLRHKAQDGGESEEVIAKITDPQVQYSFTATGVIVK
mgnify:CR=1 FL=1